MIYRASYSDGSLMDVYEAVSDIRAWEIAVDFADQYGDSVEAWYV